MNERLIPEFEELVDSIADATIEKIKISFKSKEYSIENLMLNIFTACIFKTVAQVIKPEDAEYFCDQIKTNLMTNFEEYAKHK